MALNILEIMLSVLIHLTMVVSNFYRLSLDKMKMSLIIVLFVFAIYLHMSIACHNGRVFVVYEENGNSRYTICFVLRTEGKTLLYRNSH